MSQTRERLLHDAIREADDWERIARRAIHEMGKAIDRCRLTERESARLRIAFRCAAIAGGVGWLFAWALAAWGWVR